MGWCSATDIFDSVVGALLEDDKVDKETTIKELINALEDGDWDCQQDSVYWNEPLVQKCFKLTSPELFDEDEI